MSIEEYQVVSNALRVGAEWFDVDAAALFSHVDVERMEQFQREASDCRALYERIREEAGIAT